MTSRCNDDIRKSKDEIIKLENRQEANEEFHKHMIRIKNALKLAEKDVSNGTISKEFIDNFIDKIFVTPEGDNKMRLDIRIFTGDSTDKYLSKLKHGVNEPKISVDEKEFVGQMSKKMIEAYERNMK